VKFLSEAMSSASGSIGGTTYSHNRFGMYRRARRVPVNPNTTFQQSQRDAFSNASSLWRTLTAPQRAGWEAYAAATPTTNSLGQTVFLTGAQQFTASNAFGFRLGLSSFLDAPTTPGRTPLGMPTIVLDASAATATVSDIDSGANGDDLSLFLGDPVSAGVSFFRGPYQLRETGVIALGAVAYATVTARNGIVLVAGQNIPYRLAGIDEITGRLTQVASGISTVAA
jgi:hypothetical protein